METIAAPEAPEESLDPQDWDAVAALGHRMVDDMVQFMRGVRARPAWQPIPASVKTALDEPLPREPQSADDIYAQFQRDILPYPTGNIHPRFWGWVMGTGTPLAAFADLLAACMNTNVSGFEDSARPTKRLRCVRACPTLTPQLTAHYPAGSVRSAC